MAPTKRSTTDAIKIIDRRHFSSKESQEQLRRAQDGAIVARKIRAIRIQAKLSQRQLGRLIGTTASVICRLEDDDYAGHSLGMLRRIAAALGHRVEIRFVPVRRKPESA